MKKVAVHNTRYEADIDRVLLEENDIAVHLENYNTDRQLTDVIGIEVWVDDEDEKEALELLVERHHREEKANIQKNLAEGIPVCQKCGCTRFYTDKFVAVIFYLPFFALAIALDTYLQVRYGRMVWVAGLIVLALRAFPQKCIRCKALLNSQ